jgi:hypothetical protein
MAPNKSAKALEDSQGTFHQNPGHTNYICSLCVPKRDLDTTNYNFMDSEECKNHGEQVHNLTGKSLGEFGMLKSFVQRDCANLQIVHTSFLETHFMLGAPKKTQPNGQGRAGVPKRKYTRRKDVVKGQSSNIQGDNQVMNDDDDVSANSDDENEPMSDFDSATASRATTSPVNADEMSFDSQMTPLVSNGNYYEFDHSQMSYGTQMGVMHTDPEDLNSQVAFLRDNQMGNWFLEPKSLSSCYLSTSYTDGVDGQGTFSPLDSTNYYNAPPYMGSSFSNNSRFDTDVPDSLEIGSFRPGGQSLRIPSFNGGSKLTHDTSGSSTTVCLTQENAPAMSTSLASAYTGLSFSPSPLDRSQRGSLTKSIHQSFSPQTPDTLFIQRTPRIGPVYDDQSFPRSSSATNQQPTNSFQRQRLSENPQFESAISAGGDAIRAAGEARLAQSRAQQAAGIPRKYRNNGTMGIPLTAKNYAAAGMPQISSSKLRSNTKPASPRKTAGVRKNTSHSRRLKSASKKLTIDTDMLTSTFNVVRTPVVPLSDAALVNSPFPPTVARKPSARRSRVTTNGLSSNNMIIPRNDLDSAHPMNDARNVSPIIEHEPFAATMDEHNFGRPEVEFNNQFVPSNGAYVSPYQPLPQLPVYDPVVPPSTQSTAADEQFPEDFDFEKYFESYHAMNPETSASSMDRVTDLPPLPFDSITDMDPLTLESSAEEPLLFTLDSGSPPLSGNNPTVAQPSSLSIQTPVFSPDMSELMAILSPQQEQANDLDAEFTALKEKFEEEKLEAEMHNAVAAGKMVELQEEEAKLAMERAELEDKGKAATVVTEGKADVERQENDVVVVVPLSSFPSISPVIPTSTASNLTTPPFGDSDQLFFNDEFFDMLVNAGELQGDEFNTWSEFDSGIDFSFFDN